MGGIHSDINNMPLENEIHRSNWTLSGEMSDVRGISFEDAQTEFLNFFNGCFFKNDVIKYIITVNLCIISWTIIFYYYHEYS